MDYPHPGVGPYPSQHTDGGLVKVTEEGDEIRHAWYQWVVFVLFFQVGTVFMINKTFFYSTFFTTSFFHDPPSLFANSNKSLSRRSASFGPLAFYCAITDFYQPNFPPNNMINEGLNDRWKIIFPLLSS